MCDANAIFVIEIVEESDVTSIFASPLTVGVGDEEGVEDTDGIGPRERVGDTDVLFVSFDGLDGIISADEARPICKGNAAK